MFSRFVVHPPFSWKAYNIGAALQQPRQPRLAPELQCSAVQKHACPTPKPRDAYLLIVVAVVTAARSRFAVDEDRARDARCIRRRDRPNVFPGVLNLTSTVVYDGRCIITPAPPGPIFHGRYLHSSPNSVGTSTFSALEISRPELSEDVPFSSGALLVGRAIEPGTPPQGGADVHIPSNTVYYF